MARFSIGALFALLLVISARAQPADSVALQPTEFELLWEQTVQYALMIAESPGCRNLLFTLTGQDPVRMLEEPEFWLVIPDDWPEIESDNAALTTCMPPMVSMRRGGVEVYGPFFSALTLIHELAHVGTCDRVLDGEIPVESWEDMAETVHLYCFSDLARSQRE